MKLPLVRHHGVSEIAVHEFYAVKSPVFPFNKFRGVDTILGPEMRSTGEVMGVSTSYGLAFAKAQLAAGQRLPRKGTVFLSVNDRDKKHVGPLGRELSSLGFKLLATRGTASALPAAGIEAEEVFKVNEGRPNIVDLMKTAKIDLVINTPLGRESFYDEKSIRRAAIRYNIPCITTLAAAHAAARGIRALFEQGTEVAALQDLHRKGCRFKQLFIGRLNRWISQEFSCADHAICGGRSVSPEDIKHNIRRYNETELSGYVVLGSTGESVLLQAGRWKRYLRR